MQNGKTCVMLLDDFDEIFNELIGGFEVLHICSKNGSLQFSLILSFWKYQRPAKVFNSDRDLVHDHVIYNSWKMGVEGSLGGHGQWWQKPKLVQKRNTEVVTRKNNFELLTRGRTFCSAKDSNPGQWNAPGYANTNPYMTNWGYMIPRHISTIITNFAETSTSVSVVKYCRASRSCKVSLGQDYC